MLTVKECIDYVESHMEIRYATLNGAYRANRFITPSGSVNHSVGCAQPDPEVFYNAMNTKSAQWGVTAILGDFHKGDGKIILSLPLTARNWGCGSGKKGSWNNSHIQWEICEPAGHTYAGGTLLNYDVKKNQIYFDRMWKMVVAWNVYLCYKFGFPPSTIHDHAESCKAGFGSNHGDISHWWPKHKKTMADLRATVTAILDGEELEEKKVSATQVKITVGSRLNCRETPNGTIVSSYADGDIVTIGKRDGDWGYTGIGWIHMNYTVPVVEEEMITLTMSKDELIQLIDQQIEKHNQTFKTVDQVPEYWRDAIKQLIAENVINGGTDNSVNDQDVNLTLDTLKAVVILKGYIDSILKDK